MLAEIFVIILCALLIMACAIGVIALYLALKNWAWETMDIEFPPKAKPEESYWETTMDNVAPSYTCGDCNYGSEYKYKYCPWCGMKMENYDMVKTTRVIKNKNLGKEVRM